MELTIQQGDLAFAVGRALGSVSNKSPLPLLSCILLEADKDGLRVTGTDLDVTTSYGCPVHGQHAGQSRGRRATLSRGRAQDAAWRAHCLPRKIGNSRSSTATARAGRDSRRRTPPDFPRMPELKGEAAISLAGDALSRIDRALGDTPPRARKRGRSSTAC